MSSPVPPIPNYVYVAMRLKMSENVNSIACSLFCHDEATNDVFLIGGLVQPHETLMASAIRHCRHLVNVRFSWIDHLYMAKVLNGFMDHEPGKI